MLVRSLVFLAVLALASVASAHPGHGTAGASWLAHWLEPVHVAPLLALGALAVVSLRRRARARRRA